MTTEEITPEEQADELIELLKELKDRGYIITYGTFLLTPAITAFYHETKIQVMTSNTIMALIINRVTELGT